MLARCYLTFDRHAKQHGTGIPDEHVWWAWCRRSWDPQSFKWLFFVSFDTKYCSLCCLLRQFGGLSTLSHAIFVPPEELYATQLSQLQEMGFYDTQENIRALTATAGNIHAAVERLLGNLGQ
ncbi:hypothetical protein ZIOFF_075898 [Zingiber officinale]|uniref:UBA domain-containing protein n=1 Tax=Zingiber officinale TaxID=94328 RepID=A0A8J5E861_ZINOF|nr:hypothetical protein ZIOFF_075898 [Zingiber officinale]